MVLSKRSRAMALPDPTAAKSISLALDWLNKLHVRRVNTFAGEHVSASQVTTDEFCRRLEQPGKQVQGTANQRSKSDWRNQ